MSAAAVTVLLFAALGATNGLADDQARNRSVPSPPDEPVFTGSGEAGTGNMGFRIGYFDQDDSGKGNPFLDESSDVVETIFIADYNVSDRLSAWGMFSFDLVSSASIGRLDDYPQQTGASGDYYVGLDLGAAYEVAVDRRVGGYFTGSFERDYYSVGFGGDVSGDFFNENTTLGFSTNYYYDTIKVIRFNGTQNEGNDDRHSVSMTLSLRQVLDPKMFAALGATFSHQVGFLETSYNGVVILEDGVEPPFAFDNGAEGEEVRERFPQDRNRFAFFGRARRLLLDSTAVEVGGRYSIDSWEADGYSLEAAIYQGLLNDVLSLRARYRYYEQDASEYYDITIDSADPRPSFRTQDSDYSGYEAHTVGLKLGWAYSENLKLDIGVDYTFRSDDLDFVFGSFGITRSFVGPESWLLAP